MSCGGFWLAEDLWHESDELRRILSCGGFMKRIRWVADDFELRGIYETSQMGCGGFWVVEDLWHESDELRRILNCGGFMKRIEWVAKDFDLRRIYETTQMSCGGFWVAGDLWDESDANVLQHSFRPEYFIFFILPICSRARCRQFVAKPFLFRILLLFVASRNRNRSCSRITTFCVDIVFLFNSYRTLHQWIFFIQNKLEYSVSHIW